MLEFSYLPINSIAPNPLRPRTQIPRSSLLALADSIRRLGILNPLLVGKTAAGYQLISGERRLRAAKLAGLEKVPAVIRKVSSHRELALFSVAENIHREDLNLIDQARILAYAQKNFRLEIDEIAELVGISPEEISRIISILDLPEEVKQKYLAGKLTRDQLLQILNSPNLVEALHEI